MGPTGWPCMKERSEFSNWEQPFLTADVDVYLLPEEDIALLRKGLTAQSLTEVKSILEDYE